MEVYGTCPLLYAHPYKLLRFCRVYLSASNTLGKPGPRGKELSEDITVLTWNSHVA